MDKTRVAFLFMIDLKVNKNFEKSYEKENCPWEIKILNYIKVPFDESKLRPVFLFLNH